MRRYLKYLSIVCFLMLWNLQAQETNSRQDYREDQAEIDLRASPHLSKIAFGRYNPYYDNGTHSEQYVSSGSSQVYGSSKYDSEAQTMADLQRLDDFRAEKRAKEVETFLPAIFFIALGLLAFVVHSFYKGKEPKFEDMN